MQRSRFVSLVDRSHVWDILTEKLFCPRLARMDVAGGAAYTGKRSVGPKTLPCCGLGETVAWAVLQNGSVGERRLVLDRSIRISA